ARRLVGSPAQQARAVAKAAAAEMVVGDLDHEAGLERQPMRRAARGPAARAARLIPGKAGRRNERFEPARERHAVDARESGREPYMVQQSGIVVEAEQQRADSRLALAVAETADHAVGAAVALDLAHRVGLA